LELHHSAVIANNVIEGNTLGSGISIIGDAAGVELADTIIISGNLVRNCYRGIGLGYCGGKITIDGCQLDQIATIGASPIPILIYDCSGDISVVNTVISGGTVGLYARDNVTDLELRVMGCCFADATTYGVSCRNVKRVFLIGNNIDGALDVETMTQCVLLGNTVSGVVTTTSITTLYEQGNSYQPQMTFRTVVPAAGTWAKGAFVWNSSPDVDESLGWLCVTAGVPGTWVPVGQLYAGQAGKGPIVTTPDSTKRYRIAVDNAGAITTTLL
jgi:hypothetical protein